LIFEFGVLLAFLSVVFLPLWKEFTELLKEQTSGREIKYKSRLRIMLIAGSVAFVVAWLFFILLTLFNPPATVNSWPESLNERVGVVYVYIFIVLLPIVLTNLSIYEAVIELTKKYPPMVETRKNYSLSLTIC